MTQQKGSRLDIRHYGYEIGVVVAYSTLKELGHHAGGMGIQAVAKACVRMGEKLKTDKAPQRTLARFRRVLESGIKA